MTISMRSVKLIKCLLRVMGMWYTSGKLEILLSNLALTLIFTLMLFSTYVQDQELYYSRNSLTLISIAAPSATAVLTETSKLIVFMMKRKKVTNLNVFVDNNFWKKSYVEVKKKSIIVRCDNLCYKSICLILFLMLATCSNYVITPLIGMIANGTSYREFPFPMRFETWLYERPYYDIYFILEFLGTLAVGLCISTFTSYLFTINLFTAAQFKILNMKLESLCDFDEVRKRTDNMRCQTEALRKLKKYIVRHQMLINLTKEIEDLYCYVMLEQIFGTVSQTCFLGMQLMLVKTNLQRTVLSILFLMGSFLQFFCFCYSSQEVLESSQNVSNAIYCTKWFKITNPHIRKEFTQLMRIVATRARRPCILTVGKFYPLTLATFTSVIGSSMSYFTILRKVME